MNCARPIYIILVVLTALLVESCYANRKISLHQSDEFKTNEKWSVEKSQEWYYRQQWLIGCNYIPAYAINQLEMWQTDTFDLNTIDKELRWAENIGINSIRVFLHDLLWEQDHRGFLHRVEAFLRVADKHKIKVVFVLFDSVWDPFPSLGKQHDPIPYLHNSGWVQSPHIDILKDPGKVERLKPYVFGVISKFKNDQRVLMWDLYNEPGNTSANSYGKFQPQNKDDLSLRLLEKVFEWARQVSPSQPLTAGVWQGEWDSRKGLTKLNQFMLNNSDIITFHDYNPINITKERINTLKQYGRPLVCTEYMARPVGSTFAQHLPVFKENQIGAFNWGFVCGKTQTQYPWISWEKEITSEPKIWFHDILRSDGTAFDSNEIELINSYKNVLK